MSTSYQLLLCLVSLFCFLLPGKGKIMYIVPMCFIATEMVNVLNLVLKQPLPLCN